MALPLVPLCIGAACYAVARNKKKTRNGGCGPAPGARLREVVSGGNRVVRAGDDGPVAVPPQIRRVFAGRDRVIVTR